MVGEKGPCRFPNRLSLLQNLIVMRRKIVRQLYAQLTLHNKINANKFPYFFYLYVVFN